MTDLVSNMPSGKKRKIRKGEQNEMKCHIKKEEAKGVGEMTMERNEEGGRGETKRECGGGVIVRGKNG